MGAVRVLAYARVRTHKCPDCLSWMVARSSLQGLLERLLFRLFTRRPYRCLECGVRFYDRSISAT